MSTTHTWSIAEDHNLVSVPSKNDNHLYAQYSSLTIKFASPFSLYDEFYMKHAQNLEEVESVLNEVGEGTFEVLLMIDAIQRLGIDYHFHDEIEAILQRQYRIVITMDDFSEYLYEVALRFRLLRQEDVFNNFKDKKGKFEEKLIRRATHNKKKYKPKWKMLSLHFTPVFAHFSPYVFSLKYESHTTTMGLYRASQLSVHGEDILEEARNFSNKHLNAWNTHNDQHQARIVGYCG
ncbi:(3S,6E)-nerolidol synthase 1, chloroplastic [Vitis vinifera]|uniref:(3S,6E)-nerolidol synthase 1, chloroplastic n=1 Tax=Vitis vinifera TaxID=29760 RepID=A0A438HPI1_VITVI|nr:(3S,6E)-nerolidol synthase 1, chloroplastic [Vitis vinifera]